MKKLLNFYVKINLVLLPLFFLPIVQSNFGFGKNWFLLISSLVGLLIWLLSLYTDKKVKINFGRSFGLFFVLIIWSVISWSRLSPSIKSSSLSDPFGLTTFVSLFIWYFIWLQADQKRDWRSKVQFLNVAAIILSISSLITFLLPNSKLPLSIPQTNPFIIITQSWSLTGSLVAEVSFLLYLVFENSRLIFSAKKRSSQKIWIISLAQLALIFVGLSLGIYKLIKYGFISLGYKTAWLIAADTFKNAPIFGAGIGNFLQAFNLFRPNSYNLTASWGQRFIISSSGFLHYWTELGIGFLVLAAVFLNKLLKLKKNSSYWTLVLLVLINLILPPNLLIIWLLVLVLANKFGRLKSVTAKFVVGEQMFNIVPVLTAVIVATIVGFGGFISTKKLLARFYLRKSMVAASQNDGSSTYNLQIKAIAADPNWAELRRLYSQTNIGLAQALSQQEDLTDADKEKISLLMQQAVREAKAAVDLDSTSTIYWSNLANIYRNLTGSVESAADFAVQSYQQAAILDPADPLVRMDLGALYFAAAQFDNADRIFEEAVVRKNDYANAWYNWAHTAKKLNRLADAVQRLSQAVSLVPADSGDYEKANKELLAWKKELDEAVAKLQAQQQQQKPAETLTQPQPLPTVNQEEIVNIPAEDLQPPEAPPLEPTETPHEEIPQETIPAEVGP